MKPAASNDACGPALLVAQTSFLGDVVLTTPLVSALRRRLMPRRLALLVRPEAVPLVAGHPDIDQVLVDDKRGADRGALGWLGTARRLRAERFEVAVSPHRSLRTALVLAAAGIPRRVGFRESRGARLFHERVPRDRGRHDVERNLALLAPFGGDAEEPPALHVPVAPEAARRAASLVPPGPGPLVGVAPGSVWATKRWAPEGFAAVIAALAAEGARCVVLGAPDELALAEEIDRLAGGRATVLTGRTDLATLVADVAAVVLASRGGARLASALDGVAWAGERIVLDPAGRLGAEPLPDGVRWAEEPAEAARAAWLLLVEEHEAVRPSLVAAIASALEAPGARAYRIAQEVIAFGTTLRLRHAPVRLARRDGVRLRLRTGLTPELAAGGGRAPRLPERLATNAVPTLAAAVEELDAQAATLAALLHARRVRPRAWHLVVPPLAAPPTACGWVTAHRSWCASAAGVGLPLAWCARPTSGSGRGRCASSRSPSRRAAGVWPPPRCWPRGSRAGSPIAGRW